MKRIQSDKIKESNQKKRVAIVRILHLKNLLMKYLNLEREINEKSH